MRIHRLELQAFGPFAERQEVDFDRLGAHGLFLLNGPTGAGKSSVLDAICYALYGSVPGARQGAKRLRSDHAAASLAPEVVCEFSVGGRRLEVIRNPQWSRPAKRGNGTTPEQARTLLRERIDGEWIQKSARNDEAGAEIQALLGMDREQFTRVVMLPQGEFAAFLRSDAKSRRELLQKLFSTDRFEQVEKLLAERAKTISSRLADAEAGLTHILRRARDEVQRHAPRDVASSDHEATDVDGVGAQETQPGTISELQARLSEALEHARKASTDDSVELAARQQVHRDAAAAHLRRTALATLRAAEAAHGEQRGEAAAFRTAVEQDGKAQILESSLRALDHADEALSRTRAEARAAAQGIADSPVAGSLLPALNPVALAGTDHAHREVGETISVLDAACTTATSTLGVLRAALPEEQRLHSLESRLQDAAREHSRIETALAEGAAAQAAVRSEATGIRGERTELEKQVKEESALESRVEEGNRLLATIAALDTARELVRREESRYTAAERRYLDLKELWLHTLRKRLEQAAAELAARLTDDSDCPVCGSRSHPRPASADQGSLITHEEEQAAHQDQDAAGQELETIRRVRDKAGLDAARLEAQGGDRDVLAVRVELVRDSDLLTEATAAGRTLERRAVRLAELAEQEEGLTGTQNALSTSLAELRSSTAGMNEQHSEVLEHLAVLRDGYPTLAERSAELSTAHWAILTYRNALQSLLRASENRDLACATLADGLVDSVFEHPDDVRAALLPPAELQRAELFLTGYQRITHRLEADRGLPGIAGALQEEAAGLPAVTLDAVEEAAAAEQESAVRAATSQLTLRMIEESVLQLDGYVGELTVQEQVVLPLRSEHELVRSLADTAVGGGDNTYKMSLGTYVLAARLEQVAEAATERLLEMSDGRYALVHSDALSGNRKSGLGLNVIDGWTGNRRDTATLSGGESFMAALALALGLADVVQAESGGIEIETLFVDEGFGSLDDQSLEQVMDALEGLRDGGRMVGLVSHVAELKQRIGAQLQVVKGRNGSTLRIVDQLASEQQQAGWLQTV
ncbi:SMC family ATPase [Arthrobacter sp. H20]|uniref:AAA family ATPase n=1 Tax=Arthrobacter sp. H20 TaxID=1267981 RepID=UPI0004B22241|nr:SMC family ATPase [Arthrobacter sp. H20]